MSDVATRNDADSQAYAQLASIKELVAALKAAEDAQDDDAREKAEQAIREDALSVEVRSGWYSYGDTPGQPEEFKILLSWGGPAVQIVGGLDDHCQPSTTEKIELQSQGWFIPWQAVELSQEDRDGQVADVQAALDHLKMARAILARNECPKALERVDGAINSTEGAVRHMKRRAG